jgi:HEAT repeat protein
LIKVLEGREDSVSEEILLNYMDNEDSSVRYWTVDALKNTKSKTVIEKLIELLKKPGKRVSPITEILINNNVDSLQTIYADIYNTYESLEWKRTAIEYLSKFPKEEHKGIFKDVIYNENSGFSMNRNASIGLANLNDKSSIDRIIEISEKEREGSDGNCQAYLRALSKLKGEKAKKYILSFENSESEYISEFVKEAIAEW